MEDTHNRYWDWETLGRFLVESALNGPSGTTISREEIGDFLVPWGLGCADELDEEWPEFKRFVEGHG